MTSRAKATETLISIPEGEYDRLKVIERRNGKRPPWLWFWALGLFVGLYIGSGGFQ
jgi:hypothetical protein